MDKNLQKSAILLLCSALSFFACTKQDPDSPATNPPVSNKLPTSPETKPQCDNTAFGVYKGIFFGGETGIIKVVINNGDTVAKGYLDLCLTDDYRIKDTLTCSQNSLTAGAAINGVPFRNSSSQFNFFVDANGTNPYIIPFSFAGHVCRSFVARETSTQQVFCYEGKNTSPSYGGIGSFYCVKFGNSVYLFSNDYGYGEIVTPIVNNQFSGTLSNLTSINGSFNGDTCSGNLIASGGKPYTFKATRSL